MTSHRQPVLGLSSPVLLWAPLVLAAWGGLGGCQLPPPPPLFEDAPVSPTALTTRSLLQSETIPVVIRSAEGESVIEVTGSVQPRLRLERSGEYVRASDGRVGREIELRPGAGMRLTFDGRAYDGRLLVEARDAGGLRLTNLVDLEQYVEGVVASELVLWSAYASELEAQAIAARTYAVRALEERGSRGFLWDDTEDQAYRGHASLAGNRGARDVERRLADAIEVTSGRVLVREGELVDARFHAACGGRTAALREVFPRAGSDVDPTDCAPCVGRAGIEEREGQMTTARPLGWSFTASSEELADLAGNLGIGWRIASIEPASIDAAGRWLEVDLVGPSGRARLAFKDLRARLGAGRLKSAVIASTWPKPGDPIESGLFFEGRGRGHGVGLCQEGAHDYAALGWDAKKILKHYYPGASVKSLESYAAASL